MSMKSTSYRYSSRGYNGKLTNNITMIYGTYLPVALVVFVIHTINKSYICGSMSKR